MRQTAEVDVKQRILPVVLLLILALSALVNTGALALSNPWLATVVSFASILILPGFLLSSLIFESGEMSWVERLPVSFVLGLGLLNLPGLLLLILHSNLTVLGGISAAINLVLGGLYLANTRRARNPVFGPQKNGPKSMEDSNADQDSLDLDASLNPFLLIAFLLAITIVLYIFISTMSTWSSGDFWYLDYIRDYFDATRFTVTKIDLREGWWVLQAMLDRVAGVEPLDAFRFYLPPLLLVVSLLAFYSLAGELFKNRNMALLSTLLQVLYYASSIGSHDWIGRGFFDRIVEDKFLIWLIILPVAILLMLKYLAGGKRKHLAPLGLSVAALGFTHPMGLVQGGLSFASFALVYLLFNWKRDKITRFVTIFTLLLLFLSIPLVQRRMAGGGAIISGDTTRTTSATFNYATATAKAPVWLDLYRTRLLVFSAVENEYMAHPHLIAHPLTILAILLTSLLIQHIRTSVAAQFLFSNMAIPLLVLYNPVTAPLLGRLITPWMLYRISWSLPVSLTVGFFLYKIIRWMQRSLVKSSFFARRPHLLLQVIPVLAVVLVAISLPGHIADGLGFLKERKTRTMSQDERTLLTHLRQHVASDSVIMAEPAINDYIPAFVSSIHVLTYLGARPSAREDIDRFYGARLVNNSVLDVLERWDARYVIIEREHDLAFQFSLLPTIFTRLYRNAEYELYEVASDPGPNHVVAGNTYLIQGEWDEAIAEYEKALALNPEDTLAYFGLGQVYQAQAMREEAQAAYRQAIVARPDNVMARLSLAEIYTAEEKVEEAISLIQEAIELRPDYLASFEALGDLYRVQGEDDEAFRQYEKAIDFPPDTGDYHLALGDLYWAKGLLEKTMVEYKAAIALGPYSWKVYLGSWRGYMRLAQAYQAEGRLEDVIAVYQKAIALEPGVEQGYVGLGDIYLAEGLTEQVIALYRDAARRNFNSAWPHIEMGKIYLGHGIVRVGDETN